MQPPTSDAGALPEGALFHGRYRVVRTLGRGAMGIVYEVHDERTNGRRALKLMLPSLAWNEDARARFQREALVVGGIESEHVVLVSDAGIAGETPFVVMELLRGRTLEDVIDERGRLPWDEALLLLSQVARALDKTSAVGIVHRDIKPENVFVTTREDGSVCAKLVDFGLAKVVQGRGAAPTLSMGTPLYMSPEQVLGEGAIGPAADLYSLGFLAYTLLVGETYWKRETEAGGVAALLTKILAGTGDRATDRAKQLGVDLPAGFDEWFAKATSVDPSRRFASAREQIEALAALWRPATTGGHPSPGVPLTVRLSPAMVQSTASARGRRWGWIFAFGAVASVALVLALAFGRPRATGKKTAGSDAPAAASARSTGVVAIGSTVMKGPVTIKRPADPCGGVVCGTFDAEDPTRIVVPSLLETTNALAHSYKPAAKFQMLLLTQAVKRGALDATGPQALIQVMYIIGDGRLVISLQERHLLVGILLGSNGIAPAAYPPSCSFERAWAAAVEAGQPEEVLATVQYLVEDRAPVWRIVGPAKTLVVDAQCHVRP